MRKELRVGSEFYRDKKLKTITVHVTKETHRKLKLLAVQEDRSFQKTVRRILEEYADKVKI